MSTLLMDMSRPRQMLLLGIISLGFGVLILIVPRILNYVVAMYLIVIGILFHRSRAPTAASLSP